MICLVNSTSHLILAWENESTLGAPNLRNDFEIFYTVHSVDITQVWQLRSFDITQIRKLRSFDITQFRWLRSFHITQIGQLQSFDITQSALPGKKNRNCNYALVFEATSPKLTGVSPWTLYHRLGPPAGCEKLILRVFDDITCFRRLRLSTITTFDNYEFRQKCVEKLPPNLKRVVSSTGDIITLTCVAWR